MIHILQTQTAIGTDPWVDFAKWIGLVGGILGIISFIFTMLDRYRDRRRLEFRVLTAVTNYISWYNHEIQQYYDTLPYPHTQKTSLNDGEKQWIADGNQAYSDNAPFAESDAKESFTVIEFSITNHFMHDVQVGRFTLDQWMYADHFERGMMDFHQDWDYRVFDIHTKIPTDLSAFFVIPPKATRGLRIEIRQKVRSAQWKNRARYKIDLKTSIPVEYFVDGAKWNRFIDVEIQPEASTLDSIYRWSDLLGEMRTSYMGQPVPQKPPGRNSVLTRFFGR